ncbi:hypothetical protein N9X32_01325, partial [Pseudomonadales bacterium]|nr:hypothetical protein [Pseudomonadales bacterium]
GFHGAPRLTTLVSLCHSNADQQDHSRGFACPYWFAHNLGTQRVFCHSGYSGYTTRRAALTAKCPRAKEDPFLLFITAFRQGPKSD